MRNLIYVLCAMSLVFTLPDALLSQAFAGVSTSDLVTVHSPYSPSIRVQAARLVPQLPARGVPATQRIRTDPDVVVADGLNIPVTHILNGTSINWVTGATCDEVCDPSDHYDFNIWRTGGGDLSFFFWGGNGDRAGLSIDGTTFAVLARGAIIGPDSNFISDGFPAATVNWRQPDNVDGYLGFRFDNNGTLNYGYLHLTTTGTTGFPAMIVGYAYNQVGNPISIPIIPEIEVSPASFSFSVVAGDAEADTLTIANTTGGTLSWEIELEVGASSLRGGTYYDPALDETLDFANFQVISPANGGTPVVQEVPAGLSTSGRVVGFSFQGTVAGIGGNGDWASDLCMQIVGPDGSSYSAGGSDSSVANCRINLWDFHGSGSTNDGTYASSHLSAWPYPIGAQDLGDWSFTFIHGWDFNEANPMDWSDVTVTLHKVTPEPCDVPGQVSWMSVDPLAGTTQTDSPSLVDVMINSDGLAPGTYHANLCVNSDDGVGNTQVVVPVELTVKQPAQSDLALGMFAMPDTVDAGGSVDIVATVANFGPVEATEVVVALDLSAELGFVSGRLIEGGGNWDCLESGGLVTCEMVGGTLAVNHIAAVLQLELVAGSLMEGVTVETTGLVSSANDDPNPGNNAASVMTTIMGDRIFSNGFELDSTGS